MQIDLKRFHATFFEEASEHLATLEESLLTLEQNPHDDELLNLIFRAAHSIKGSSGTFGFVDVSAFTHRVESLLERVRQGQIKTSPELIKTLLRATDVIGSLLAAARSDQPAPMVPDELLQALNAWNGNPAQAESPASQPAPTSELTTFEVVFRPNPSLLRQGMDPALLLRDLASLGEVVAVQADTSRLPALASLTPDECYLSWTVELATARSRDEVQTVFLFVEDGSEIVIKEASVVRPAAPAAVAPSPTASVATPTDSAPAPAAQPTPPAAPAARAARAASSARPVETSSIRVSVEKVDELINLVGELIIAQSMVNQAVDHIAVAAPASLQEALLAINRTMRDLHERVMSVRMLPLANVFRRFPRLVHDLADGMSKQCHVEIIGEDTELDKQMIEQIGDPLVHLVRNAIDHGIETPDVRTAAGKPTEGKIWLRAYHEGGSVVIEVADDGKGLDADRIRRKAVERGLIGADERLSDEQIHQLIFAPGLSTAQTITDVSGRGVGMDVVKRNVESLNGSIAIESTRGVGSTFRVRLPLTLAILDGLSAGLGGQTYIVPLLSVVESFQPKATDLRTIAQRGEVVMVRGRPVPLLRLHQVFATETQITDPTKGLVVVVENQGRWLAILVDELLGQSQVVMKSLETNYEKVEGVSAATILGDGQVAFILDVAGLHRLARLQSNSAAFAGPNARSSEALDLASTLV